MKYLLLILAIATGGVHAADITVAAHLGKVAVNTVSKTQKGIHIAVDNVYKKVGVYADIGGSSFNIRVPYLYSTYSEYNGYGLTYSIRDKIALYVGYTSQLNRTDQYKRRECTTELMPCWKQHIMTEKYIKGADLGFRYKFGNIGSIGLGYQTAAKTTYMTLGVHLR